MNPEIQDQINRMNRFNENDSNKMIKIKELFASKFTLVTLISSITVIVFYYVLCVVNQLHYAETINFAVVLSSIGENLLNCIFPGIFVFSFLSIYIRSKNPSPSNGKDGVLNKLMALRGYSKFYFIVNIIGYASNAFLYLNFENLSSQYPELFVGFSEIELEFSRNLGLYFLILTALNTCIWYSLSKASKNALRNIVLDINDQKFVDVFIFIGFLILMPVLETIGTILALFGINNPLTSIYFEAPIIFTDIMYLIYNVISIISIVLISLLVIKVRKILIEINGSNNPLNDGDVVYTIDLEEDDK